MANERRKLLGKEFKALGIKNVYFQPPKTTMLKYPCMIYKMDNVDKRNADDYGYLLQTRYLLTYITDDPDDDMVLTLLRHFRLISWANHFTSDNLNHYNFNLYF